MSKSSNQRSPAILLLCLVYALSGCGGGGGSNSGQGTGGSVAPNPPAADSCGVESQKAFVSDVANEWYLWYDELAAADASSYDSANAFLRALTAPLATDARDPGFSYVTTRTEDEAGFTSGAFVGFGFRFNVTASNQFYFVDVFEGSPAGDADLDRGDEVIAIDVGSGFETLDELAARGATSAELFGASEAGVERGFRVLSGNETRDVVLSKRELDTPPLVGEPLLLARDGLSPVGYLNLRSFTLSASAPFAEATQQFRDAGVTDLVIDLRYNGGGLLEVTERVLNLLGGDIAGGAASFRITHNDKQRDEDVSADFASLAETLSPLRIAFITTEATASASEVVINSLAPYVETVLVGSDTLGKAVGQYAFDLPGCETRLRLVSFELQNGEGQGGYYTGLASTGRFTLCPAQDDITRPFGDPAEMSLKTALDWLNTGTCGNAQASRLSGFRSLPHSEWEVANAPQGLFQRTPWVQ